MAALRHHRLLDAQHCLRVPRGCSHRCQITMVTVCVASRQPVNKHVGVRSLGGCAGHDEKISIFIYIYIYIYIYIR